MSFPFARIRHLLIDLDGVIYRGNTPLPGAGEFLHWLGDRGITIRLVTNNSTLTPDQYVEKLSRMGISVPAEEIFTSALATGQYLQQHRDGTRSALVVGETGLRQAVEKAGLRIVDGQADWVVVGLDRVATYDLLARASLAVERGARFVGSNPDSSYPTEDGLVPGAGALIGVIEATTGVEPIIIGKPKPLMLDLAMRDLGGTVENTAMLGDRLNTDILAASELDMPSILVLTGVSTRQDLEHSSIQPGLVVDNLFDLMEVWQG